MKDEKEDIVNEIKEEMEIDCEAEKEKVQKGSNNTEGTVGRNIVFYLDLLFRLLYNYDHN
jgi:hypothetical protein